MVCERMHELQQLRKGLADRLHDISSLPAADGQIAQQHAAHKQALIQTEVNNLHMQLLRAAQVRSGMLLSIRCSQYCWVDVSACMCCT